MNKKINPSLIDVILKKKSLCMNIDTCRVLPAYLISTIPFFLTININIFVFL